MMFWRKKDKGAEKSPPSGADEATLAPSAATTAAATTAAAPPAAAPPADAPPADAPPADAPLAGTSPSDIHPADISPAGTRPAGVPAVDILPSEALLTETPPADIPPADIHAAAVPMADASPAALPGALPNPAAVSDLPRPAVHDEPAASVFSPAPIAAPNPQDEPDDTPEARGGWLSRLTAGLSQSSRKIGQGIGDILTKRKLDQDMLDQLEEVLITADLGPRTAAKIVADFGQDRFGKDISADEVRAALADSISAILSPVARPLDMPRPASGGPFVILVCGVNGVGKTTTIGKIAHDLKLRQGRRVMVAAGDTFRAAALEQLDIWAGRAGVEIVKKETGADAAAVAYEAYAKAKAADAEILLIDTAGRLHNKANLMAELEKIVRVLKKQEETLPHAVILVLDATTGQNAQEQVRIFRDMVNVTGLVVTKLDGSAKGGVVVGLADQFGLPIHMIGVGEGIDDLRPFDAADFARSLTGAQG